MGLFDKKNENKSDAEKDSSEKVEEVKKTKEVEKENEPKKSTGESLVAYKVLLSPIITEKATNLAGLGKYVFKVDKRSGKREVTRAIEDVYNVKVEDINIVVIPSKSRRFGRTVGKKPGYKKAIVTLKEGDKIDLVEGV